MTQPAARLGTSRPRSALPYSHPVHARNDANRSVARRRRLLGAGAACALGGLALAAAPAQKHPDVVSVQVRRRSDGRYDFDVTVSSPYDTPQRYADGFRATGADGQVFGERKLLHDHAGEQPFTRDLHGVRVPPGVRQVRVQARDQVHGYGGRSVVVDLPGR